MLGAVQHAAAAATDRPVPLLPLPPPLTAATLLAQAMGQPPKEGAALPVARPRREAAANAGEGWASLAPKPRAPLGPHGGGQRPVSACRAPLH